MRQESELIGIRILPSSDLLRQTAATEGWWDDTKTNWAMGYGKGLRGREKAWTWVFARQWATVIEAEVQAVGVPARPT